MKNLPAIRKISCIAIFAYSILFYGLLLLFPGQKTAISDLLTPLGMVGSLCLIGWSLGRQTAHFRKAWAAFFLGVLIFFFSELLWYIDELLLHTKVPFPSLNDLLYLISTLCFFVGVIFYIRLDSIYQVLRTSFDLLITLVTLATVCYAHLVGPLLRMASIDRFERLASLLYPITELSYVTTLLLLLFSYRANRIKNRGDRLIALTFVIWFAADQIYAVENALNLYSSGNWVDPLWPAGTLLLGFAALYSGALDSPLKLKLRVRMTENVSASQFVRVLIPYLSFCALLAFVIRKYLLSDPLIVGTVIAALLIIARQIFTMLENQRLLYSVQQANQSLAESKRELETRNLQLQELNFLKEQEALTDYLTGLYNRRYINRRIQSLLDAARSRRQALSLLLLDIDEFKTINDHWGHDAGDMVLQQIAFGIKNGIRTQDILGRFGGDEFVILLPDTNLEEAKRIGERLCAQISQMKIQVNDDLLRITLSVGGTQFQPARENEDLRSMIFRADIALYEAKGQGRNRMIVK